MRRSIGILSTLTFIAAPLSALALAGSPAALLAQMNFRGNPHTVEAEFHAHGNGMYASVWMKGAAEGKTPATVKAWENITIDVAGDGMYVRAKAAIRIYDSALYAKLLSIEGNLDADMSEVKTWTQKPWVKIEIPESAAEQKSFVAGIAAGMRESGADVSEEDIRALLNALADALFTLETTRYQGGAAYSLRLAPDYLNRAIRAVQSSPIGRELGLDAEDMDLPEIQPVNLHIRVNTNDIGELVFLKWYAATEAEGVSVITQGKSQWQAHPVNVEVPKHTMTLEEFSKDWGMEDLEIDRWEIPSMDTDMWEAPMEEDDWSEESDEVVRPYRTVPHRIRQMEAPRRREGCTATPGTPYYLQLARKGICDLPPRSTYRVNDTTR